MQTSRLGELEVPRIGLGVMGMSAFYTGAGRSDDDAVRVIHRAVELGISLIDTAEAYGPYVNEELLGRAIKGRREQVVVATKFGLVSHTSRALPVGAPNSSPDNIRAAVEGSLQRLQTDYLDLYYQHRVDPDTPIEEVVGVLSELVVEGKVRHIGLSEAGLDTIRRAHAVHPIAAVQSEYSLWSREPESQILPALRELGIGFVPYSPLGRGFLTGRLRSLDDLDEDDWRRTNPRFAGGNLERNMSIVDEVQAVAAEVEATAAQVALAWLLAQGTDIVPIPGSTRAERVEENALADQVSLTGDQVARLNALTPAAGERYDEENMSAIDG